MALLDCRVFAHQWLLHLQLRDKLLQSLSKLGRLFDIGNVRSSGYFIQLAAKNRLLHGLRIGHRRHRIDQTIPKLFESQQLDLRLIY